MSRHVASTSVRCPQCGHQAELVHVANADASQLRCSSSLTCRSCSYSEEAHGPELSEAARAAFYAAEGRWVAVIRDLGPRKLEALQLLRDVRSETPAELMQLVREGRPIVEGTLVEVERVNALLREAGVDVVMKSS